MARVLQRANERLAKMPGTTCNENPHMERDAPRETIHLVTQDRLRLVSSYLGTATPIMLSRVTSCASSASLMPSVPAGRIGRTR